MDTTYSRDKTTRFVHRGSHGALDVLGPTIEFLTLPEDGDINYCVMIGTIPPGGSVPLHSHADTESFYLLSGSLRALYQQGDRLEWRDLKPGDFVHVSSNAKHAWQNASTQPTVQLITTTPKLGRFFREIGRAVSAHLPAKPPTTDDLDRLIRIAAKYEYWLGSPEENAAVGIFMN
jgi:quercetin dioxygenase-like cupin family protein